VKQDRRTVRRGCGVTEYNILSRIGLRAAPLDISKYFMAGIAWRAARARGTAVNSNFLPFSASRQTWLDPAHCCQQRHSACMPPATAASHHSLAAHGRIQAI